MFGKRNGQQSPDGKSYILHQQGKAPLNPKHPLRGRFTLQKASGGQDSQDFENFEQVMHFLLDELLEDDNP